MIGRLVLLVLMEDRKCKFWFCHPNSAMFCWIMPAEAYSVWGWIWLYRTSLFTKCSIASLKVKQVPCARASCPGPGRNGELAYAISVLHEYVLYSERSLFFCIFLFFFLFPQHALIFCPFVCSYFFLSFLIASPGHPLQITPLENSRLIKITVVNLSL